MADSSEKTEDPTGKKLEDARKKGQLARSRELSTTLVLIVSAFMFLFVGGWIAESVFKLTQRMFILSRDETYDITHMFGAWGEAFSAVGPAVLLYMVVAMIAGIYGSIALGGFNFTWEGAKPKGSKMSPIQGFKRMFGMNGLVELLKSIAKVVVIIGMAIGALLFADAHYAVGFALITGCANGVHVGSMHLAQLFPDTVGSVTTVFNGAHQMGSLVFLAFLGIYGSGVSLPAIFRGYAACLAGFAVLHGCVIQPSTRYRKGDQVSLTCAVPCLRAHQTRTEENKPGFVASSIAVMKHTVFLPLLTYKATILLSLQFFVAVLQPRLAEDGRSPSIARDMVIIFNVFSAVLGLVVGLPVFGRILDRGDTITVSRWATLLAVLYDCLLASSAVWNLHADVASTEFDFRAG